jgi:AcrR family transcriptional regulator
MEQKLNERLIPFLMKMVQKVNGKQSGRESRQRIIKEAVRLFARQGYGGTGLRELAAAADVNLAMVNYFFGSKKGLLKEILDDFLSGYLAIAEETLPGDNEPQYKLRRFISAALAYFSSSRDSLIVTITELPHDDPEIIAHKAAWGRRMMAVIDREICHPYATATGARVPATMIGPMLTSVMASRFLFSPVMEDLDDEGACPLDATTYAEVMSEFFLHGLVGLKKSTILSV